MSKLAHRQRVRLCLQIWVAYILKGGQLVLGNLNRVRITTDIP